jgi:cobalt-zinc-cadmium efflux system outer membrane protein
MKTFLLGCSLLAAVIPCHAGDDKAASDRPVPVSPAQVNEWSEVLRTNHPALRAAQSRSSAAALNAQGVRRWDDPMAMLGGSIYNRRWMSPEDEGDLSYGVEQKLPIFGKERAARTLADTEVDRAETEAEARFQELRRDLAKALFALALTEETARLGREDLAWLDTVVTAAEARYAGGMGGSFEVLRLQNERARRATQWTNQVHQVAAAHSTVNRALGRDLAAPLPPFALPEIGVPVAYTTNLIRMALRYEPRLQVLARERRTAEATVEVTRRSQRPDLALGVEGRQFSGDGGFRDGFFSVKLNLPWFNRANYRRDLARDRDRLRATEHDQTEAAQMLAEEIHHLTIEIEAAHREAVSYRDEILPRAQQALESAQAAWSNGRGMMLDVLEARRMLVESRLMLARAIAMQWTAMSELVLCCGLGDLEALQMLNDGRSIEELKR